MAKKHIQSYTAHDIHFDGYTDTDGVYYAFKATIPAGYKAPKNVVSIEEEDLEKLQKSHVFKALVEAKKVAFIDQLPESFDDPIEQIAAERTKTAEAVSVASVAKQEAEDAKSELERLKRAAAEQGIVL